MARGRRLLEQDVDINTARVFNPRVPADPLDITALRDLSPQYVNVASVEADTQVRGNIIYVATFDDFFGYSATDTTARDGVTVLNGPGGGSPVGRFHRMGVPSAKWRALAASYNPTTDTGGIFWDPVGGNDEATGIDATHGIKTTDEIARRLSGPTLSADPVMRQVSDYGSAENLPLQLPCVELSTIYGVPTVITSVTLTGATAFAVGTEFGSLTSTGFDWTPYVTTDHTVFARRANATTGQSTWAALQRQGATGTVMIGQQFRMIRAAGVGAVATATTPQPFTSGDTVDLVRLPKLTTILMQGGGTLFLVNVELSQSYPQTSPSVNLAGCGSQAAQEIFNTCQSYTAIGCAFGGGVFVGSFGDISRTGDATFTSCAFGSSAQGNTSVAVFGTAEITNATLEKSALGVTGDALINNALFHLSPLALQVTQAGLLTITGPVNGILTTSPAQIATGGVVRGVANILNNLGAGSTAWTIDGIPDNPTIGPRSIVNGNTGTAAYV